MELAYISRLSDLEELRRKIPWNKPLVLFGTDRLVDCLQDFGPADWQLSCLICKTLWNYSEDMTSAASCFGEDTNMLQLLLTAFLGEARGLGLFSSIKEIEGAKSKHDWFGWEVCPAAFSGWPVWSVQQHSGPCTAHTGPLEIMAFLG